ncbi:MAG: hypothetical protein P8J86_12665 [Phycisphaerales bacterium]|nr:hypothetical protein [Phycisphaerales bacterium]
MMAACILLPPADDLERLTSQRDALGDREKAVALQLAAYTSFLSEVEQPDSQLIQRLVECELNQVPAGQQAVLMSSGGPISTLGWLQEAGASHQAETPQANIYEGPKGVLTAYEGMGALSDPDQGHGKQRSFLQHIASSQHRLWVLGASGLCIFLGLMTSMPTIRVSKNIRSSRIKYQAKVPRKKTPKCLPSLMTCGQVVSAVHGSVKSLVVVEAEESDDEAASVSVSDAADLQDEVESVSVSDAEDLQDEAASVSVSDAEDLQDEADVVSICPPPVDQVVVPTESDTEEVGLIDSDVSTHDDQEQQLEDDGEWEYEYVEEIIEVEVDENGVEVLGYEDDVNQADVALEHDEDEEWEEEEASFVDDEEQCEGDEEDEEEDLEDDEEEGEWEEEGAEASLGDDEEQCEGDEEDEEEDLEDEEEEGEWEEEGDEEDDEGALEDEED